MRKTILAFVAAPFLLLAGAFAAHGDGLQSPSCWFVECTVANLNVTGSTVPANGIYLGGANSPCISSNTTQRFCVSSGGNFQSANSSGPQLNNTTASATVATVIPNRSGSLGFGGAANTISINNGTTEYLRWAAPAASTAGALYPVAPFTGGTGTTTFPLMLFDSGTDPTDWSTAGTLIGFNAPSGFTGNFLDAHVNGGASVFKVASTGAITGTTLTTGGSASNALVLQRAATTTAIIQTDFSAGASCVGSAQDDLCIRANGHAIALSGDNGTGYGIKIKADNTLQFGTNTANGTATVAGTAALGPAGTACVIASWVTMLDSAGNTRYMPLYSCS